MIIIVSVKPNENRNIKVKKNHTHVKKVGHTSDEYLFNIC